GQSRRHIPGQRAVGAEAVGVLESTAVVVALGIADRHLAEQDAGDVDRGADRGAPALIVALFEAAVDVLRFVILAPAIVALHEGADTWRHLVPEACATARLPPGTSAVA